MSQIEALNSSSLYFNAAQQAASEARRKEKPTVAKKVSFGKVLGEEIENESLIAEGYPTEIIGMNLEDAVIFLKDSVDSAGDELTEKMTAESFAKYRTSIKQFMNYVVKNSFDVVEHKRFGMNRKGKKRDPAVQIQLINQKLDTLASDLLYNHMDKLKMLAKVDEINGLIVDLLAA